MGPRGRRERAGEQSDIFDIFECEIFVIFFWFLFFVKLFLTFLYNFCLGITMYGVCTGYIRGMYGVCTGYVRQFVDFGMKKSKYRNIFPATQNEDGATLP